MMSLLAISAKLKELRLKKGITLQELARRAGTSAAAVHRYENGWERFELQTLQKIVGSLGANISVSISEACPAESMTVKDYHNIFKPLFWDVVLAPSQLSDYEDWLILRVLDFGNLEQVKALLDFVTLDKVKAVYVRNQHKLHKKTQAAWSRVFNLQEATCTLKPYQKSPVPFWQP